MPKRDLIVRLEDIRINIEQLIKFAASLDSEDAYDKSLIHKLAFERIFQVIGEALFQITKDFPNVQITDARKIIGLRHVLAHDYFKINHHILWMSIKNDIPGLRKEIIELIDKENLRLFGNEHPVC